MRKIKLNPTKTQKLALNKFADAARFTYNECVAAVNDRDHKVNRLGLRNSFVTAKDNAFFDAKPWLLETPKVIRQQAAFEAAKNFKSAFTAKKNGTIDNFRVGFKSKRTKGYVLGIEKHLSFTVGKDGKSNLVVLPETIGAIRFFEKPPIDSKPTGDCSVMRDPYGDFWLMVPVRKAIRQRQNDHVVSIDPGIRKPFSCYSPTRSEAFFEGDDMKQRVGEIQGRVQRLDARIAAADKADRPRLKAYRQRLFRSYKNVRDDCHWKIISRMTDRYGIVLLPELSVKSISGNLRAKSNREMFGISHYLFRQRMAEKCQEKSVAHEVPNEAYTSKTCGRCGHQNDALGSSEVFWCPKCTLRCHRDLHAARNIFVRWIAEQE